MFIPDDARHVSGINYAALYRRKLESEPMLETGLIQSRLKEMQGRSAALRGYL